MQTSYPAFLQFENKLALRSALHSAVPSEPGTIQTAFLRAFAGIETLVLDFRRREALEFVLQGNDWTSLKDFLRKCIKNSTEPKLEADQRASLYCKLEELNRVSLREAFDLFCKRYSIYLEDLWPVFGENGLAGLVDIRNKIIHGDPFPHDMLRPLVVAKEHLKYVLERMLSRVLQWGLAETKINLSYLKTQRPVIKDMPSERAKLSEYICEPIPPQVQPREE